jgi:hypothetical protein
LSTPEEKARLLIYRIIERGADAPLLPDWEPDVKGNCTCEHSWLFHQLAEPHVCNECKTCNGYAPRLPA